MKSEKIVFLQKIQKGKREREKMMMTVFISVFAMKEINQKEKMCCYYLLSIKTV
jgi:hypothetical protein